MKQCGTESPTKKRSNIDPKGLSETDFPPLSEGRKDPVGGSKTPLDARDSATLVFGQGTYGTNIRRLIFRISTRAAVTLVDPLNYHSSCSSSYARPRENFASITVLAYVPLFSLSAATMCNRLLFPSFFNEVFDRGAATSQSV